MIEKGCVRELHCMADGTPFRVSSAENQSFDAGMGNGAHAHYAGLQADIESGVYQSVILQALAGLPKGDDFRVGAGVMGLYGLIPAFGNTAILKNQYRANRHFALLFGALRQAYGVSHPFFIRHLRRLLYSVGH
jgi:hypothetical protein